MDDKYKNEQILGMLALSEEVNSLNFKLQQLLRGLDSLPETIEQVQTISDTLNNKIGNMKNSVNGYTAPVRTQDPPGVPSYVQEGIEQEIVTPPIKNARNTVSGNKKATETPVKPNNTVNIKKHKKNRRKPLGNNDNK